MRRWTLFALASMLVAAMACADDGAGVRTIDESGSGSGTGSGTGTHADPTETTT